MRFLALVLVLIFAAIPAASQTSFSEQQIACFAMQDAEWQSDQFCQDQQFRLKETAKKLAIKTQNYEDYYGCFENNLGSYCDDLGSTASKEDSDEARHIAILLDDRGCRLKDVSSCYSLDIDLNKSVSPEDDIILTRAFCIGGAYDMCEDVALPIFVTPSAGLDYVDCIVSPEDTAQCTSLRALAIKEAYALSEIEYSQSEFVQCFHFDEGEACTQLADESRDFDEDLYNDADVVEDLMPSLRTIVILEHGCQVKHARSCDMLSEWLTEAPPTTDNRPLFERLCDAGSDYACQRVKVTYSSPRSKEDIEWAQRYFEGQTSEPEE